jgi:hypothetical protein
MSPLVPLTLTVLAALLITFRVKRLAARPERRYWGNPHPRAMAEAAAASLTVLIVGLIAAASFAPTPFHMRTAFTFLALGICCLHFRKALLAPRA